MKILVYGSKGWIGKQVVRQLQHENIDFIESIQQILENFNLERN